MALLNGLKTHFLGERLTNIGGSEIFLIEPLNSNVLEQYNKICYGDEIKGYGEDISDLIGWDTENFGGSKHWKLRPPKGVSLEDAEKIYQNYIRILTVKNALYAARSITNPETLELQEAKVNSNLYDTLLKVAKKCQQEIIQILEKPLQQVEYRGLLIEFEEIDLEKENGETGGGITYTAYVYQNRGDDPLECFLEAGFETKSKLIESTKEKIDKRLQKGLKIY